MEIKRSRQRFRSKPLLAATQSMCKLAPLRFSPKYGATASWKTSTGAIPGTDSLSTPVTEPPVTATPCKRSDLAPYIGARFAAWWNFFRKSKLRSLTGALGESLAARFLERQGFAIWRRNWRCKAGEIDIIAVQNRTVHIVEVKTRFSGKHLYTTLGQMTERKRRKLEFLALRYCQTSRSALKRRRIIRAQIDFVGIEIDCSRLIPRCTMIHIINIVPITTGRSIYHGEEKRVPTLTR